MISVPPVLPLARDGEPVRYVMIDDEPRYRQPITVPDGWDHPELLLVGGYGSVEAFLGIQREACHVVVLDLCLNRQTGDKAILHGVRAIQLLAGEYGHRILVHTADERPEPVARCVAAGAAGFVSKYTNQSTLALAVSEIGRQGQVVSEALNQAVRRLAQQSCDIRLSGTLEETLVLLDRGLSDIEIAQRRQLSPRTVEDHKRKILVILGTNMEAKQQGFAGLTRELGIGPGDLVNDHASQRPMQGLISRALSWASSAKGKRRD
jgi:DNA-binding NarL/FixJ family response regulator